MKTFKQFIGEGVLKYSNTAKMDSVAFRDLVANMKHNGWAVAQSGDVMALKLRDITIEVDLPSGWDDLSSGERKIWHYRSNDTIHL